MIFGTSPLLRSANWCDKPKTEFRNVGYFLSTLSAQTKSIAFVSRLSRNQVIDIVRSNVRAVLQRAWHTNDIESLKLSRIFNRVS